jgi:CheY-like chemotaxis protein
MDRYAGSVLIVDDIESACLLSNLLDEFGYEVVDLVASGEAAMAAAAQRRPGLILMDYRLAGRLDGSETAWKLRAASMDSPVAFVTGEGNPDEIARMLRVPNAVLLPKPFGLGQMLSALDQALGLRREGSLAAACGRSNPELIERLALVV